MEADCVSIWPRMEPFLLGALQVAPSSKLSLHYLRKMAVYVRTRGCFPVLGWPMWRHIACGKLQLPEDLAWLYFETFGFLIDHTPEERLEWAECVSQCTSKSEIDQQRNKLTVDTLQFLLFLYIQQLNRLSLRTSLIGEEWPSHRTRSPSPSDREAKTSSQNKNWDDQAHLSFVQSHLAEILELLVEPGQLSQSGQALRDCQISLEAVQSLGLLLEGSVCRGRAIQPVHRLLTKGPLQTQAGYSTLSCSFSLHKLLSCLQQNLTLNPFGITACLRSGKKLAWAQQVEGAMKRAKIARNTHMAPPGSKMVLMSQVFKQTLAKTSDKLTGANIKIHRCSDAFIYLLSPLRSVSVDKCRDCTVVLGPVETSVHIHSCQNLRVVCVAGRIAVGVSSRCTIHALTPTRPLLLPGNTDITLGPFHTFYPSLEDHMASVGLAVVPNAWDRPLLLGTEGLINPSLNTSSNPDPACYHLLPPAEFHTMVVPFQTEGDTCEVPGGLPLPYQAAQVGASWWSWHGARARAGGCGHWTQPVEKWGQWTLTMPGHYAVILPRFSGKTEPLQLHPGGEWCLGGVRTAQLHGLPVRPDQGGVPGVPALDGPQRPPQLLYRSGSWWDFSDEGAHFCGFMIQMLGTVSAGES